MSSDLLPLNATPQERALALALSRLSDVPTPLETLWHPATCPAPLLPWLAWALSVDRWDSAWSDTVKRTTLAASVTLHQTKGTPAAVERALVASGAPNATVFEWWEYAGAPYHFHVEIDLASDAVSGATEASLLATIAAYKNARSVCDGLVYNLASTGAVPAPAVGAQASEVLTVYPL